MEEDSKTKIKIVPLISEMDRKLGMPRSEVPIGNSHIPTKAEMKKKSLEDMLKRIQDRG
ncbi:Uncharacterised protein [uncultured archaeon]|nr:Uncharacterised protein [uncultured archaeon]